MIYWITPSDLSFQTLLMPTKKLVSWNYSDIKYVLTSRSSGYIKKYKSMKLPVHALSFDKAITFMAFIFILTVER